MEHAIHDCNPIAVAIKSNLQIRGGNQLIKVGNLNNKQKLLSKINVHPQER